CLPGEDEGEPVGDAPEDEHEAGGEPYPGGRAAVWRAGGEVDGHEQDGAGGQGEGEEDGQHDEGRSRAQGQEAPQQGEDEQADGRERERHEHARAGQRRHQSIYQAF
ncbi:hypothetical protein TEQG_01515, partial [Trichophyton equinum CBS 127.97]